MIEQLLEKVTDQFIDNGIINDQDKELYSYGLQQGLIIIANIFTMILIGLLLGMVWQSILFMVAYIPLRSFAGGYHAKTQLRCYLYSIVVTLGVLLGIKLLPWTSFIILGLLLITSSIIFCFAPIEDKNKPLSSLEVKVYKKRTRSILAIELCIIFILLISKLQIAVLPIVGGLFVVAVMLVFGKSSK